MWWPDRPSVRCSGIALSCSTVETQSLGAFIPVLRSGFLFLSRQGWLRRWMESSWIARRLTSRFVAGLTLDDGIRVCATLRSQGMMTSLDHLGENVTQMADAQSAREA